MKRYEKNEINFCVLNRQDDLIILNQEIAVKCGVNASFLYGIIVKLGGFVFSCDEIQKIYPINPTTYHRLIAKLADCGYVSVGLSSKEKKKILCSKNFNNVGLGECVCEWCGVKTTVTHKHHYPVQKKDGGTQTVNICPNCHQEFHSMDCAVKINDYCFCHSV